MRDTIKYPAPLRKGDCIAITAPSSGVEEHLHHLLIRSKIEFEDSGYEVMEGKTIWTNDKCVSSGKEQRARELQDFLSDERVNAVIPPWGGEFLIEILPLLDWDSLKNQQPKWILGYSDISTFNFAYTLRTGCATAHGVNYIELGSGNWDETTARWEDVLSTEHNQTVVQSSSAFFQSFWDFSTPGYQLDTPTRWKTLGQEEDSDSGLHFTGRLLGGCLDTLSILVGTPFAPINEFSHKYCKQDGIIWYMESSEMNAADIYRHLWQMKQCGWFEHANGFLFGRPNGYAPTQNFELQDALRHIFDDIQIPVIYDADIGHVPPQLTLVNGALAEVSSLAGRGKITMSFC